MKYALLGQSGLVVSRLALGAMTFGGAGAGAVDADGAAAMVGAAIDGGINFFDTADVYSAGQSETLLGQALKGRRDEVLVATKVGSTLSRNLLDGRLSAHHIHQAIDASLGRLGMSHVDVYICHRPDYLTPLEETLRALDQVVRSGKARYIGFSNWPAWMAAKAVAIQKQEGWARFVTGQMYYSLVGRDVEAEVVPCALDAGCGLMVWSPLASGFLTGKYSEQDPAGAGGRLSQRKSFTVPEDLSAARAAWGDILDTVQRIARAHDTTAAAVSLAWLMDRPSVSTLLIGATRSEQLAQNLAAADLELTPAEKAELEAVSRPEARYPRTFDAFTYQDRAYRVLDRLPL